MESVSCWPTITEPEVCPGVGLMPTQWHSAGGNWFALSQQVSVPNSFLVRSGICAHSSFSGLGFYYFKKFLNFSRLWPRTQDL